MMAMLKSLIKRFWRKLKANRVLRRLPPSAELHHIHRVNRERLGRIPTWIDEEVYRHSLFRYGIPETVFDLLNKDIGDEPTYSDLMLYFAKRFQGPLHYLEIGVSVGKNFFQMCQGLDRASTVGIDIKALNPVLEQLLGGAVEAHRWKTPGTSLKKSPSQRLTFPNFAKNKIAYLSGDIWDEQLWRQLKGQRFNLIFSDALHLPEALICEYDMIRKCDLLSKQEFVWLWDDLGGRMTDAFFRIAADLKRQSSLSTCLAEIYKIRGWLGNNERYHVIGVVRSQV